MGQAERALRDYLDGLEGPGAHLDTALELFDAALVEAREDCFRALDGVRAVKPAVTNASLVEMTIVACEKAVRAVIGRESPAERWYSAAALAEAREEGLQEGMQAFTAEAAESVEVARREAWHDLSAEEWNELYPVGVPVRYWPVLGDELYRDTITRGQAWTLGDGHSIVTIQGQPGGVSLRHLAVRLKGEEH